jgi:uncharacterized protein
MPHTFLTAEWRKLAMINYAIDPEILKPYVPAHTELDLWNDTCYVSLIGFMFMNTKVLGIKVPFHVNFEEVNLRFYVRYKDNNEWKRGVVFIKEIVPKPALSLVANLLYGEHYATTPMKHSWLQEADKQIINYSWKLKSEWQSMQVSVPLLAQDIAVGSEEEFITEHYWGYTKAKGNGTSEYGVEHPRWQVYPALDYNVIVDFAGNYGSQFGFLNKAIPKSVFVAEGSAIKVKGGRKL